MDPKVRADIDVGLHSQLALFALDPYILHAFRGEQEGSFSFTWDDIEQYNIFLCIPEDKIDAWSKGINLMYTQLIRFLERRPDRYTELGKNQSQILLLMDEFPRFGKLQVFTSAISTLRSKSVNICIMIQSIAQLDRFYGEDKRRIILDNCPFQVILRANDPETQQLLSQHIGTTAHFYRSKGKQRDFSGNVTGYSEQLTERTAPLIPPHRLASFQDVIILSPFNLYICDRIKPNDQRLHELLVDRKEAMSKEDVQKQEVSKGQVKALHAHTKGASMMNVEEYSAKVEARMNAETQKAKVQQREQKRAQKQRDSNRSYRIGELVAKYFPDVNFIDPDPTESYQDPFEKIEAFLYALSINPDIVDSLREQAEEILMNDPDGSWRF